MPLFIRKLRFWYLRDTFSNHFPGNVPENLSALKPTVQEAIVGLSLCGSDAFLGKVSRCLERFLDPNHLGSCSVERTELDYMTWRQHTTPLPGESLVVGRSLRSLRHLILIKGCMSTILWPDLLLPVPHSFVWVCWLCRNSSHRFKPPILRGGYTNPFLKLGW